MKTHSLIFAAFVSALVLAMQAGASAHAFLDSAEPAVGSKVKQPPAEVKIRFSAPLESEDSTIQVFDGKGNRVDKNDSHLAEKEPTLLIVSVSKLAAGSYKVVWRVASAGDHHKTHGSFTFEVAPAG